MKDIVTTVAFLLVAGCVAAQEQIPPDRAQQAAKILTTATAKIADLQIKVDADAEKPFGLKKGEIAVLAIPDKNLTADRLAKAGADMIPVGQLWLKGLTPLVDGSGVAADKLRMVKITVKDESQELPVLLLGVRARDGKKELVIYAKAKEPLLTATVEESSRNQEQPIEIEGKGEGETGTLTLVFAGKYQAKLAIGKAP